MTSDIRTGELIESLFACATSANASRDDGEAETLMPAERSAAARFGAKRRAEFTAGRACARRALAAFGFGDSSLPIDPDRRPRWPAGIVGSITHTSGHCGAVVARSPTALALGLDVERIGRVGPELWPQLFVESERALLEASARHETALVSTLLFSAKEATYKCRFGITGGWLDFRDVVIEIASAPACERGTFSAKLVVPDRFTEHNTMSGRYAVDGGVVWTGVAASAPGPAKRPQILSGY